jgi:hypothetical protein
MLPIPQNFTIRISEGAPVLFRLIRGDRRRNRRHRGLPITLSTHFMNATLMVPLWREDFSSLLEAEQPHQHPSDRISFIIYAEIKLFSVSLERA